MAIDIYYQRKGLGELLLVNALKRSLDLSQNVASFAVVVEEANDIAFTFYQKHGFISMINNKLYLPMRLIEKFFS